MSNPYAISAVAALVGEPSRAAILLALLDGCSRPAGELAREARLTAAAASLHLAKLTQGGLLMVQRQGRHRYYRLANERVAHALESLGVVATLPLQARALSPERAALRLARTCYDHLAGEMAVELATMLERAKRIQNRGEREYEISADGVTWFAHAMEIDTKALAPRAGARARSCVDWTERRPHIAGALGAAILQRMFDLKWAVRVRGTRALRITPRGCDGLHLMLLNCM